MKTATLTSTFSDRFADPLELLQTPWIDGREHADHDSGIYFTLHLTVWTLEQNKVFRCRGSDPYDSFQNRYTGREKRGDHDGKVHFTLHLNRL